jgi:hypothetical protein
VDASHRFARLLSILDFEHSQSLSLKNFLQAVRSSRVDSAQQVLAHSPHFRKVLSNQVAGQDLDQQGVASRTQPFLKAWGIGPGQMAHRR